MRATHLGSLWPLHVIDLPSKLSQTMKLEWNLTIINVLSLTFANSFTLNFDTSIIKPPLASFFPLLASRVDTHHHNSSSESFSNLPLCYPTQLMDSNSTSQILSISSHPKVPLKPWSYPRAHVDLIKGALLTSFEVPRWPLLPFAFVR